jgi:hypothetical protein
MKVMAYTNSCRTKVKLKITTVRMPDNESGTMILTKVPSRLSPFIMAASSMSRGTALKKPIIRARERPTSRRKVDHGCSKQAFIVDQVDARMPDARRRGDLMVEADARLRRRREPRLAIETPDVALGDNELAAFPLVEERRRRRPYARDSDVAVRDPHAQSATLRGSISAGYTAHCRPVAPWRGPSAKDSLLVSDYPT